MHCRHWTRTVGSIERAIIRSRNMATGHGGRQLNMADVNPRILTMEYAVRGPLVIRAAEIEKELVKAANKDYEGPKKPFPNVIRANIGDAHAMGQAPITFIRQVVAACTYPDLIKTANFPDDVKQRAKELLAACGGGSIGAYSASVGVELIRRHAAEYIQNRDGGIPSDPESIVLSGGASDAIRNFMKLFKFTAPNGKPPGVMIPIPQYPLYSASVAEFGMNQVGYYLNEDKNWSLDVPELKRSITEARKNCNPRLLCVINPGNPTGQVLSRENIESIIKFAKEENLFLFADEVYQDNVYDPNCKFHSFKKVLMEMGEPYSKKLELASFHSVSKGYMGECGMRGGYAEIVNVDPDVMAQFKKSISAKLCSTVTGQIVMDCVVKPPKQGEPSYELWAKEKAFTLKGLADKAKMVYEAFNSIDGIKCNPVQGAMYAFPQVMLPPKAIEKAKSMKQQPDFYYAMKLLEETGICIVPGSGFCQQEGTYHFRTTILPPPSIFKEMLERFKSFHKKFLEEHK